VAVSFRIYPHPERERKDIFFIELMRMIINIKERRLVQAISPSGEKDQ
jgi:hypothetical protein